MMIYKQSKLKYSSVHIDRVYHFIRDHFSRIPLYTYISFNGPILYEDQIARILLFIMAPCFAVFWINRFSA